MRDRLCDTRDVSISPSQIFFPSIDIQWCSDDILISQLIAPRSSPSTDGLEFRYLRLSTVWMSQYHRSPFKLKLGVQSPDSYELIVSSQIVVITDIVTT